MSRAAKVVLWVIGIVIGLLLLVILALNLYMRIAYSAFYDEAEEAFPIPGISEGFVPQDLDHVEADDVWIFSGYVSDEVPSPLYRLYPDGTSDSITLELPDGSPYTGHGGGVTSDDDFLLITKEGGYLAYDLADVMSATGDVHPRALGSVDIGFSPAFANIENGMLYMGDYYYPGSYETPDEEHITMPDGVLNQAIMCAYPADGSQPYGYSDVPDLTISIPDSIQGFCLDAKGSMILSASANIQPTRLYTFDTDKVLSEQLGTFSINGAEVPLYGMWSGNQSDLLEGPPMGEGIESYGGRVYLTEESASNKYIFGKLYGAGNVYSLGL